MRVRASLCFALLAGMASYDAGVPMWRDWIPGDVADFTLVAFFAAYYLIGALQQGRAA